MAVLICAIQPESAILKSGAQTPLKTRVTDTEQDFFALEYSSDVRKEALFSWPVTRGDELGTYQANAKVVLRWFTEEASGDAAWDVYFALVAAGEDASKAFGSVTEGAAQTISGAGKENTTTITVSSLLSGIDATKDYRLVMKLVRRIGIASDVSGDVFLVSGMLKLFFDVPDVATPKPLPPKGAGAFLYWMMQEKGAAVTLEDQTDNSYDSVATTAARQIPLKGLPGYFLTSTSGDVYSPKHNIGGLNFSFECIVQTTAIISTGDQIFNFSERTAPNTYVGVFASLRIESNGNVKVFTTTWVDIDAYFRVSVDAPHYVGVYYRDVGGGQCTAEFWCDGKKIWISSPYTPSTAPGADHSVNIFQGGWQKAFFQCWDYALEYPEIQEGFYRIFPYLADIEDPIEPA